MTLLASGAAWVLLEAGIGLSLLLGVLWWFGAQRGGGRSGAQRVVRLTAQDSVHVVELEGRRLLVGTGASGPPRLICELDPVAGGSAPASGGLDV